MRKITTLLCSLVVGSSAFATVPTWFETDSATAVHNRLLSDFSLTFDEARQAIREKYGFDIDSTAKRWLINKRYIETRVIDGVERVHRKAARNLELIASNPMEYRGCGASAQRIAFVDSVLDYYEGKNALGAAHQVTYKFNIDVPYDAVLGGDTLRVWMPYPIESERQSDVQLISSFPQQHIISTAAQSVHRSIYFEQPVAEGKDTHFEYTVRFVTKAQYFSPQYIEEHLQPYDTQSALYKEYTAMQAPHIVNLAPLARAIVGEETNPYKQSELIYNYIVYHYPWAGAREYSTIECIPAYVIAEQHGDCGQVALLYISLMRSLGVPARWESGWMLHPGEKNLHDWAEVYFEGVGWVPVDVSFGRYGSSTDERVRNFYSTGMDAHRLAANKGVCGDFYPPKKYIRSETVDAQMGEVETSRGNLFYPGWNQHLEIIDIHPVNK
jgi:hypothetical protein